MEIRRSGSQPSLVPPGHNFTGNARIDPLFNASAHSMLHQ